MVWIGAKYKFASTFSYRIPYFSSSYALSAPSPSPSTIKLALIATAINRTGNIEKGKMLFQQIRDAVVTVELPQRIVFFKAFMKRLKKKRKEEQLKTPFGIVSARFESTFGIREYILYDGFLIIYLNVSKDISEEVSHTLKNIQYLGTSDSTCFCFESGIMEPQLEHCIKLYDSQKDTTLKDGIIFLLSDFTEKTTFEAINPFSSRKMKKEDLTLKPYIFPLKVEKKDKNCTIYRRL
jgi:CRISPR-associated Cas5-like protein